MTVSAALAAMCALATALAMTASALALPDGRHYEMVSPEYKAGFGATRIEAVGQNGEVVYFSPGAFAGAPAGVSRTVFRFPYIARRAADEWATKPLIPPAEFLPYIEFPDMTATLGDTIVTGKQAPNVESNPTVVARQLYLYDTSLSDESTNWKPIGVPIETVTHESAQIEYMQADSNFCHVIILDINTNRGPLLLKATGAPFAQYEVVSGCNGEQPELRLLNVNNAGGGGNLVSKHCANDLGVETYDPTRRSSANAISSDGSEVFFTTCIGEVEADHQLFVRLGGMHTVEVSQSLEEARKCGKVAIPCPGASGRASANFVGASEDGTRVYFTTTATLTGQVAEDPSEKLYLASIGCPGGGTCGASERAVVSLVEVSPPPGGGQAGVNGVVKTSPDGSHVYFIASGQLLSASQLSSLEAAGEPAPAVGAENMYVYDADSGTTSFVADLCSGYGLSGTADDTRCQSHRGNDDESLLNTSGQTPAQTAGADGRFLVFASYGQLTADDGDAASDVYRYDALTGSLIRVSAGEGGYHADGNGSFDATINGGHHGEFVVSQHELNSRSISEDGRRIIFTSAEPLSPQAVNGLTNVYEWHETSEGQGYVALVSGGAGAEPVEDAVITPSGEDLYFVTGDKLLPQDSDLADDIYDARLGPDFARQPTPTAECEGEGCYGALTNPVPLLVPGSAAQTSGEHVSSSQPASAKKLKARKKRKVKKKKKGGNTRIKAKHSCVSIGGRGCNTHRGGGGTQRSHREDPRGGNDN